ncbi:MAG: carboxylating nicotinate-nucleotide diphosphorylase [Candidatus Marinimicrobia bacterium]|nr:carboxylating nicotinate-nucleotide diphosphorylase [Candidatus Neomarinimicrobiota bacterium]
MTKLNWKTVNKIIENALAEDIQSGDITSIAMNISKDANAKIVAKENGILAGVEVAKEIFKQLDDRLEVSFSKSDGENIEAGDEILTISGSGQSILTAERVALNLLGRMSGIATTVKKFANEIKDTKCKILDTRKTMPLLRELDKYSVECGGGKNHRYGLFDMILIKENHIRWIGGVEKAIESALEFNKNQEKKVQIEIEVTNLSEFQTAIKFPIDRIMLDHFSLSEMEEAVKTNNTNIELEVSGDVNMNTVKQIAETGVNFISVGALTHSVRNFDFSLLFGYR